jgi:hypothetical protein
MQREAPIRIPIADDGRPDPRLYKECLQESPAWPIRVRRGGLRVERKLKSLILERVRDWPLQGKSWNGVPAWSAANP